MMPLVTIVMPSFNVEKYIGESIRSVIEQTYKNWELLIIDDCSTDNTVKIISEYEKYDVRVKGVFFDKKIGVIKARQIGIDRSKGRYIAFLDSDDLWDKNKLAVQLAFMENENCAISCTNYGFVDDKSIILRKSFKCMRIATYIDILKYCPVGNSTVIYDKNKLPNLVIPNAFKREDYALWLLITRKGINIRGVDRELVLYRIRNGSVSRNKILLLRWQWNVYRKFERFGIFKSAYYVIHWCMIKIFKIK